MIEPSHEAQPGQEEGPKKTPEEIAKEFEEKCELLRVGVQETERISELQKMGLKTLFLCIHGRGRSPHYAEESTREYHIPAVSLHGGIEELQKITDQQEYEKRIKDLAQVENVVLYLTSREIDFPAPNALTRSRAQIVADLKREAEASGNNFYYLGSIDDYYKKIAPHIK